MRFGVPIKAAPASEPAAGASNGHDEKNGVEEDGDRDDESLARPATDPGSKSRWSFLADNKQLNRSFSDAGDSHDSQVAGMSFVARRNKTFKDLVTRRNREREIESSVLKAWKRPEKEKEKRPEDLITAEQVKVYHTLLEGLSEINDLHACVNHPCGNIYWDFKTKKCLPGRVWKKDMPETVKQKIDRDFTPAEVEKIEATIRLHSAPPQPSDVSPRAIVIIGPAAAGKSAVSSRTEDMLQISLNDYVEIDGDEFRSCHFGWMSVLKGDKTTGYHDALNILLKYTRKLKKRVLEEALTNRKNIILPTTGSNFEKLSKEVEEVRARGYRIDVIGLVVSYKEARARALNRAHENGRWNDGGWNKWESAMRAITYFMDPMRSDMCIVYDNQDFNNPTTIYTRTQNVTFVEAVIEGYRLADKEEGL